MEKPTLQDYAKKITTTKCRYCGEKLNPSAIEYYPHEGGFDVEGFEKKQWLYITCPNRKCGYQYSLWKIIEETPVKTG